MIVIHKKEKLRRYIFALAFTLFVLLGVRLFGSHFIEAMWIVNLAILGISLSIIMLFAGFIVLRSLAAISAEISLLIFIAQSYCDVPGRSAEGDEALKSLLILSLIFIIVVFCRSLFNALKENYKHLEKEKWSKEKIGLVFIFLVFTGLFVWQIYLVTSPIILNLCIYR